MTQYSKWLMMFGVAIVLLLCLPSLVYAQVDPAGDPDAPIDGGLGILLAAGVGYGFKKMRDHKRNKIQQS